MVHRFVGFLSVILWFLDALFYLMSDRFVTQDTVEEFLLSHEDVLQKGIISHDGAMYTQVGS